MGVQCRRLGGSCPEGLEHHPRSEALQSLAFGPTPDSSPRQLIATCRLIGCQMMPVTALCKAGRRICSNRFFAGVFPPQPDQMHDG
jgi:hypothetical protein